MTMLVLCCAFAHYNIEIENTNGIKRHEEFV